MTTAAYLQRWATVPSAIPDGHFRCELCGGVFPSGDDDEARAEAESKGIDPADSGLVCDACYAPRRLLSDSGSSVVNLSGPWRPLPRPGPFVARARRRVDGLWVTTKTY